MISRFELQKGERDLWVVLDKETGIAIEFKEGDFNGSQKIAGAERFAQTDFMTIPRALSAIGDWLYEEHPEVL